MTYPSNTTLLTRAAMSKAASRSAVPSAKVTIVSTSNQPMAILHQRMPQIAHFRFAPLRLLIQPSIWISGRLMCFITALLPVKIHFPPVRRGRFASAFWAKALVASPGFDQRTIHREVFIRQIRLGSFQHPLKKDFGHLFVQ